MALEDRIENAYETLGLTDGGPSTSETDIKKVCSLHPSSCCLYALSMKFRMYLRCVWRQLTIVWSIVRRHIEG